MHYVQLYVFIFLVVALSSMKKSNMGMDLKLLFKKNYFPAFFISLFREAWEMGRMEYGKFVLFLMKKN